MEAITKYSSDLLEVLIAAKQLIYGLANLAPIWCFYAIAEKNSNS